MTRILVLYYSSYGQIERMAEAVVSGARETDADVVVKRVPELVPEAVMRKAGYKLDQGLPSQTLRSSRTMTPSSSARQPASGTSPAR
jgi:NAD(P)H dehydrogenase (quinone)